MALFDPRGWKFLIFGAEFCILDMSRWLYIQFWTRNPDLRSKNANVQSQEGKIRKNEIESLDFLSQDFLSYVPTVFILFNPSISKTTQLVYLFVWILAKLPGNVGTRPEKIGTRPGDFGTTPGNSEKPTNSAKTNQIIKKQDKIDKIQEDQSN